MKLSKAQEDWLNANSRFFPELTPEQAYEIRLKRIRNTGSARYIESPYQHCREQEAKAAGQLQDDLDRIAFCESEIRRIRLKHL